MKLTEPCINHIHLSVHQQFGFYKIILLGIVWILTNFTTQLYTFETSEVFVF
jgi:hypothetical protein